MCRADGMPAGAELALAQLLALAEQLEQAVLQWEEVIVESAAARHLHAAGVEAERLRRTLAKALATVGGDGLSDVAGITVTRLGPGTGPYASE